MKSTFTLVAIFLVAFSSVINAQEFFNYNNPDMDNSLQALAIDQSTGLIWVGTNATSTGETIAFLENEDWTVLNANDLGLLQGRATDMVANDGIVEVCSYGGLSRIDYNNESFETWTSQNSDMTVDAVLTMAKDNQNDILYVGLGSGNEMQSFDGTSWNNLSEVKFSKSSIFDHQNQTLWVGGNSALYKIKDNIITKFDPNNTNIPFGDILDLVTDGNGDVWLVQEDQGLLHFDGIDNFDIYNMDNSDIHSNSPSKIAIDNNDKIWIGGFEYNALSSFEENSFTHFLPFVSELPTANIRQMKCDQAGNLWMASSMGLVKYEIATTRNNEISLQQLNLYPNPVRDQLTIEGLVDFTEYIIYNNLGHKVASGKKVGNYIDLSLLEIGNYWLGLFDDSGRLLGRDQIFKVQ